MKVNPRDLQAYGRTGAQSVSQTQKVGKSDAAKKVSSGDGAAASVTISPEAQKLASASSAASATKVTELKAKIAAGEFKVDAKVVARKMVDELA